MSNTTNLKTVLPGNAPMAADIDQMRSMLAGTADIGYINLPSFKAAPSAPTLGLGGAGVVNNTVKYQLVIVTGWTDSYPNFFVSGFVAGAEASISPSNQSVNVTIPAFSAPVIGYAIYRTAGAGASGTEKFVGWFTNPAGGTFSDNMSDANRGTGMPTSLSAVLIPANVPTTNTTGTVLCLNGGANNISAPPVPLIMAASNTHGVGMTEYGDLVPINPSVITSSDYWAVRDKSGNPMWKVYLNGGAVDHMYYSRFYGGIWVPAGQSTWLINGIGNNYSWTGTIASGGNQTVTHNLGHVPFMSFSGTKGNLGLTTSNGTINTTDVTNYSSGGNSWTGTIYFW